MLSAILVIQNSREEQILKMAFEQYGIKVLSGKPTYQYYTMAIQYKPDFIIIELPPLCVDHLYFSAILQKHSRSRKIPIFGYGANVDEMTKRGYAKSGITTYSEKPLKFSHLLGMIDNHLKKLGKNVQAKPPQSDKEKNIELILSSEALPTQKIEAMATHVSGLMAFPFTIAKVLHLSQDEKTGAGHLAQAITADPAIATHLLKISNSVFFASSNRRISSIKDAIVRIGFNETKKIVMSMSVISLFDKNVENLGFDRVDFWYHCVATAVIAEQVAKHMGKVNSQEAFLAGLLSDLGVIMLDEFFPTIFEKVLEHTTKENVHFESSEKTLLNITHNDLIAELFPKWKLPQGITDGVTRFNDLNNYNAVPESDGKGLAICIAIGNQLAKLLRIGRECDEYIQDISSEVVSAAGLDNGFAKGFFENTFSNVELFRRFLQLEPKDYIETDTGLGIPKDSKVAFFNLTDTQVMPVKIHLENRGFVVESFKECNCGDLDYSFDLIIIHTPKGFDPVKLDPFYAIAHKNSATAPEPGQVQHTPILLFSESIQPAHKHVTVLSYAFDLQQLEYHMYEFLKKPA